MALTSEMVCSAGRAAGLDVVGVASAEPFTQVRRDLEERKAAGLHGGMQFTYRNPARSTDPGASVKDARSLVVAAHRYAAAADGPADGPVGGGTTPTERPMGRVARYATADHYAPLRTGLREIATLLKDHGHRAVVFADDNSLVDRAAAHRAGLGWWGKNANLLLPGQGSWFVLGSVVTDAPLVPTASAPVDDGCGSCARCLAGCPTEAIVAPGVVDARRCLAWLVQQPGTFPHEHRVALGDRFYGCDDCQEVCPPSRVAVRVERREVATATGAEPEVDAGREVDVLALLGADDDEILARWGRWYIPDRDPDHLRRNALLVLGNTGDGSRREVVETLARMLASPSALVREHAAWAAERLGRPDLVTDSS